MHGEVDAVLLRKQAHEKLSVNICYLCHTTIPNEKLKEVNTETVEDRVLKAFRRTNFVNIDYPPKILVCTDTQWCNKQIERIFDAAKTGP